MSLAPRLSKLLKDAAVYRVRQDQEYELRRQLSGVQGRLKESSNLSASRELADPVLQHFAQFREPLVAYEARLRQQVVDLKSAKIVAEEPVKRGDAWVVRVDCDYLEAHRDLVIGELPNLDDPVQSVAERFDDGQRSVVQSQPKRRQE